MGELPDEVMEICQQLAKHLEKLRGLAEMFLNDLSENWLARRGAAAPHPAADEPRAGDV